MDYLNDNQFWLILGAVAIGAYLLGRMSAGGSPEERAERAMRERQGAETAFANLSPEVQQEIDALLAKGDTIAAIRRFRKATGAGLKESKLAIDVRRKTMSGI